MIPKASPLERRFEYRGNTHFGTGKSAAPVNVHTTMKKNLNSQPGIIRARILVAAALCSLGTSFGFFSFASTPPSSNITVPSTAGQTITVTWTGEVPAGANPASD